MDDNIIIIISIILHGCELARKLEGNLTSMVNEPNSISESCSEIIKAFMAAQEKLNNHHDHHQDQMDSTRASTMEEGLRSSNYSHGIMNQRMIMESQGHEHDDLTTKMISSRPSEQNQVACLGGSDVVGGSEKFETGQSSGSSRPSDSTSTKQRRRRRKERDGRRRTVRMSAPTIGNTEIPPEDGFTWRKYGQKEIIGSTFPRAYFRCTHQRLYHCPAKKQVQRLDEDPNTFEVTYTNYHTCHMSATAPAAPSITLPLSMPVDELTTTSAETFLSIGIGCPRPTLNPSPFMDPRTQSFGLLCCDMGGYNYQPMIMDMVDTMFNSGPSGNTNLDQIFSSVVERKWDQDRPRDDK